MELGFRFVNSPGSGLNIFRSNISFRNIVPEGSGIMEACKQGDIDTVRVLFETRHASPFDVSANGNTPLKVMRLSFACGGLFSLTRAWQLAIENEHTDLVEFLLQNYADPNVIVDEASGT
jgi:hypothetical protein